MPAIPQFDVATAPQLDSLAPREPDAYGLDARQPELYSTPEGAIISDALSERALEARQIITGIIPTYYRVDGPAPGAVVGIVLGSVCGFLLLVFLLHSLFNNGGGGANIAGEEEIVVRRPRRNSHSGRSRRSTRTEVREYSRSPRRSGARSAVIVEERRGAPRPRSIVVESRVPGDDVVEVIEEHDEYRTRRGSRRNSGYR